MTQTAKERTANGAHVYLCAARVAPADVQIYLDEIGYCDTAAEYGERNLLNDLELTDRHRVTIWQIWTTEERAPEETYADLNEVINRVGRCAAELNIPDEHRVDLMSAVLQVPDPLRTGLVNRLDAILLDGVSTTAKSIVDVIAAIQGGTDPYAPLRLALVERGTYPAANRDVHAVWNMLKEAGL